MPVTRIAGAAVSLVSDGDTLILDVGTTNLEVARGCMVVAGSRSSLRVCRSAIELSEQGGVHIIVTVGSLRPGELSLTGGFAEDMMRRFNCELAFIGVGGVAAHAGFTDYFPEAAHIKGAAMSSARRVVALADLTKVGRVAFSKFAELSDVDLLVTNAAPDAPALSELRAKDLAIQLID
jgi:DeoR family transcriptional regulator of aga operon/DeoR family fructose operon transcriptional repressor